MTSEPARSRPADVPGSDGGNVVPIRRGDGSACALGKCDGTGWLDAEDGTVEPCECRSVTRTRTRARGLASAIPARYRGVSFDRPPLSDMARAPETRIAVGAVKEFAEDIDARLDRGDSLWLSGSVGTGKTTLAMAVSSAAAKAGRSVAIYSLPQLLARIRRTYDAAVGEDSYVAFFERLTSVDLLHIDDLGAEKRTDWVLEQLYAIVDERYGAERSMLVTTNLEETELEEQIGGRTVSRLVEMCGELGPLQVEGRDHRY
ncbi:MAG: ATP-binding protein [Actinomycetota bacterium]|nr:ATP-binding protein [Actinomycetota bacterium]